MKKAFLFILVLTALHGFSQKRTLIDQWLLNATGRNDISVTAFTNDDAGNLYIAGKAKTKGTFAGYAFSDTLHPVNFITETDSAGNIIRHTNINTNNYFQIMALSATQNGKLTVCGYFKDTIAPGNITLTAKTKTPDAFIAVLNENGDFEHPLVLSGDFAGAPLLCENGDDGMQYFAIPFKGNLTVENSGFHAKNKSTLLLVFDNERKIIKSFVLKGKGDITVNDMKIKNQRLLITGGFQKRLRFNNKTHTAKGKTDAFVALFDTNLKPVLFKQSGGAYRDYGYAVAFDKTGNFYCGGTFEGKMKTAGNKLLVSNGNSDIFVVKYNENGKQLWADNIGGNAGEFLKTVQVNKNGNLYVAGSYRGKIEKEGLSVTSGKFADNVFIAKYDDNNRFKFIETLGDTIASLTKNLFAGKNGNLYVTGNYRKSFKSISNKTKNTATKSFYLLKLHDCDESPGVTLPADTAVCAAAFPVEADSGFVSYLWNGYVTGTNKFTATETGYCTVEATDSYGCKSEDSVYVILHKPATIDLGDDITVTKGETVVLDAGSGYDEYVWNNKHTGRKLTVNTANLMPGKYYYKVTGTAINGCKAEADITVTVTDKLDVTVFPNPARDMLTVKFSKSMETEKTTVRITTELGTVVLTKKMKPVDFPVCKVNIGTLARGTYYLIITQNKMDFKWKFVKL